MQVYGGRGGSTMGRIGLGRSGNGCSGWLGTAIVREGLGKGGDASDG